MDTAGGAVTVPSIVAANRTSSSNVIINANQSNNNGVGSGGGTLIHSNIISNSSSNSSLISSNGGVGGSGGGNSSSSSSSTSSNSSGYGSTSATPTNSYETHAAASTTPVAIAEPIIPIATVAAVSPFYSEAITSQVHESQHYSAHQQQQHPTHSSHLQHQHPQLQQQQHLQQTHQHQQLEQSLPHSQRQQQYFSSYDYQHPQQQSQEQPPLQQDQQQLPSHQLQQPQIHNSSPNYQLGGSGSGSFDAAASNSPVSGLGAYQQTMVHPYKASGVAAINFERHNRSLAPSGSSRTAGYPQHLQNEATTGKPTNHSQYLGIAHASATSSSKSRSSTSLLGASLSSTPTTTKPQATATPFYAQPLAQQQSANTTSYYDQLKHKMPLDYHENYGNFPNAAAAAAYHQHQKYYAAAKSQLKDAYGVPQTLASGKSLYHNSNNFYAGASAQHASAGYDKYMYPSATYPAMGYETSPADAAYRKASAASGATLNSPTWPWGIEYASGNSRTIPPPTGHLPTATVAPTHASYIAANSSHLSARDPYYMSHDKYGMKYDKYPPSYQQTAYVSPPSARHHLWSTTHNALNERLAAPPATHAPHVPHALHAGTPYYPSNAPPAAINARQSCCTQPYAAQNCYYQPPPPGRITHGQPVTPMVGQASSYMPGQSASSHHQTHLNPLSSSCKYGGSGGLDYGAGNKLKPPNDLYLSSHYENANGPTAPPPTHYPYGSAANNQLYSSNQMHHGQQPAGPLIARDPSLANSATFSNDLTYDTYLHESAAHMNAHSMGGIPPGGGPTAAKRALLDYRKPQPPPPTTAQVRVDTYDQHNRAELHYRDSTELLNTPETTTAFNDYDSQSQASAYATEETTESQHKSGEEANKNLSLRDFIANWNDDEEDYATSATNEVLAFDQQSSVINEVLQNTNTVSPASNMEQIPALIPDKPCVTEVTEIIKPLVGSPTPPPPPPLSEMDASQYTTNLPDIIIDIEKSNVNTSLGTPPNAPAIVDTSSLSLDNFDVEKELDQLQQMQRKTELDSVIVKDDSSRTDIKPNKAHESDSHQSKNLTTQISFDDLNLESTKAAIPATRPHLSHDIEGYDSGSSRHSNESSLFEKEYETFINKISSNNENLTKAEKEIEQKVQDFSKFYKRKRKLKDEELKSPQATLEQETKKLKSSDEEEVNDSNFPRVYTKKSRNRSEAGTVKRLKPQRQLRRRKPTSLYYKKVHSLRRFRLQRDKQIHDSRDEIKEKHLPLIKRQSIKNYSLASRSSANLFNPLPLKTLVLNVINSEEFRGRIMNVMVVESQPEVEEKHICVDPSCETCEVIRSLMEPEVVEETLEPNDILIPNSAKLILSEIQTDDSAEQGQIVLVQEIEGDPKDLFPIGSDLPEKAEIESAIIIKGADVPIVVENKLEYEVLNLQTTKAVSSGVIIKADVYEEPIESLAEAVDITPQDLSNPQPCKELPPTTSEPVASVEIPRELETEIASQDLSNPQTSKELPTSSELVKAVETLGEMEISPQEASQTSKELPPSSSELVTAVETLEELETKISQDLVNPQTFTELPPSSASPSEPLTAVETPGELATEIPQSEQTEVQNANVKLKETDDVELQTPKQVDSPRATSVIRKHESNSVERDLEIQAKKKCIEQESPVPNDTKDAASVPQIFSNLPTVKVEAAQKTTVICQVKSTAKDIDKKSEDVEPNLKTKDQTEADVTDLAHEQQLDQEPENLEDKSVADPPTITPNETPVVQITTVIRKHETKSKELDCVEPSKDSNAKTALPSSLNSKLQPDDDTDTSESETCSSSCSSSDNSDEDEDKDGEDSQDSSDSSDSESDSDIENETLKTLIKVVEKCEKLSKSSKESQNTDDDLMFCEIQDGNTQDSLQPTNDIEEMSATTKAECKTKENLDKKEFESPKEKEKFSEMNCVKSPAGIAGSTNVEFENDIIVRSASEAELQPKETDCAAAQSLHSSAETLLDKVSSDISDEDVQAEKKTINVETNIQSSENMKTYPDHPKQIPEFPTEKTIDNMEREQEALSVADNISEKSENELRKLSVDEDIEELSTHSYTKNDSDDEDVEQITAQIPSHNISPAKNITDDEYMDTLFPEGPIKIVSNEDLDTHCTQTEIQAYTQTEDADFKVRSPESPIKSICGAEDLEKLSPDSPAENISDEEISAHTSKKIASYIPEETSSSISAYTPKDSVTYTPEDTRSSISAYTPKNSVSYTPEETRCSSVISQGLNDAKTKSSPTRFPSKFVYGPKDDFVDLSEDTSSAEDSEQEDSDKELPEYPTISPPNEEITQVVDITEDTTSEEESDSDEADKTYPISKSAIPDRAINISDDTRSSVGTSSSDSEFNDEERQLSTTIRQATRIPVIAPRPTEIKNFDLVQQDEIETSNQREDSRSSCDNNSKSNIYESVIKSIEDVQRESESEQSSLSSHPLTPVPCVEENSQDLTESNICQTEAILKQPSEENLSHSSAEDLRPTVEFHSVIREAMGSQEMCTSLPRLGGSVAISEEGAKSPVEFHSVIKETSVSQEVPVKLSSPERSASMLADDLKTSNKFVENSLEDETNNETKDTEENDYSIPSKELPSEAMQTEDRVHKEIPNLEEYDSIVAEKLHSNPSVQTVIAINIPEAQKTTNKSEAEHISTETKESTTEEIGTASTLLKCTSNFERLEKASNEICLNSEPSVTEPNECDSEYSITSPDFYEDSTSSEDTKTEESAAELPESMEDSLYKDIPEEVSIPKATDTTETCQTTSPDQKSQGHKQFNSIAEDEHFPSKHPQLVEEDYDNEVLDLSKDSKIFAALKNDNSSCTDVEQSTTGFQEAQLSPCVTPPTPTIVYSLNESTTDFPKSPVKEDTLQREADKYLENETSRYSFESGAIIDSHLKNEELPKCSVEKDDSALADLTEEKEASVAISESMSKDVLQSSAVEETIKSPKETLVANLESENQDVLPSPEIEESTRLPNEYALQSVAIEEPLQTPEENDTESPAIEESLDSNTRQSTTIEEQGEPLKENAIESNNEYTLQEVATEESCESPKECPEIEESVNSRTPQSEPSESLKESVTASTKLSPSESLKESATESIKESPSESIEESVTESIKESPLEPLEESVAESIKESLSLDVITEVSSESPNENSPENPTIIESLYSDVLQSPTIKELCESPISRSNESNNAACLPDSKITDGRSPRETSSPTAEIEEYSVPKIAESPLDKEPNIVVEPAAQSLPIVPLTTVVQSKETSSDDNHSSPSPNQERSKDCSDHSNSSSTASTSSANERLNKSPVRPRSREPSPEMNFWNTKGKYRAWRTYQSDASKSPTTNVRSEECRAGSSGIATPEPLEGTTENETEVADNLENLTQSVVTEQNSKVTSPSEDSPLSSAAITDKTNEELSADFHGFKIQSSFDDGSDFNGFEDQHEEERIRREIENLNEDSAANDAFLYDASTRSTMVLRKSPSKSPELDELEALEKELSQQCLAKELHDETTSAVRHKDDVELETETQVVSVSNVIISTNDIEHIKKMLESDEEHPNDEESELIKEVKVAKAEKQEAITGATNEGHKDNVSSTNICVIPKLSDLCRAALNSSLTVNKLTIVQSNRKEEAKSAEETIAETPNSATSTPKEEPNRNPSLVVERELSVEEALAEMYRQAGVLLSDPEDNDSDKTTPAPTINATATTTEAAAAAKNEEAQDVLLINLHEILNSDNDVFVLQCDMNVNDVGRNDNGNANDVAHHLANGNAAPPTERVHNLQLIGIVNRDSESSEIHIISSDSESEVIILSDCDTDVEFQPPPPPSYFSPRPSPREYIPFINDFEDTSDSLSDLSTIHHEEIVPENLHKFLQEEFYKYLHEKYAQKKLSKYYHANRVLRKYKRNRVAHKYRP